MNIDLLPGTGEVVKKICNEKDNTRLTEEKVDVIRKNKRIIYFGIKRLFDIFVGLFGCLILICVALVLKICYLLHKDKEPLFFTQNRIGKNGKEFKFYKFRSMVPNADEILFEYLKNNKEAAKEYKQYKKLKNDPRITEIGNFIRKTSLDELPQFINVLKGDMSLIGNRPYLPREKEDMGNYYESIVKTKPGLTGFWQTAGRSKTTFENRLKLESYYSMHCSLLFDIKIFFKTFKVILSKDGAE